MDQKIKTLKKAYEKWKDKLNEEQVKYYMVLPFLKMYGYDVDNLLFEKKIGKGFCDIWVPALGNESLLVEVKSGGHLLDADDIAQVQRYCAGKGQEYAILTNGYEYILLNFKRIVPEPRDDQQSAMLSYVVFWFNIFKTKDKKLTELRFMNYIGYENIFEKKVTTYFCDIAQYKEWKTNEGMKEVSWLAYKSTLYNFFDFFSIKYGKYGYERLFVEDFEEYINTRKRNAGNTSISTIQNSYTHIYNMLSSIKKHGRDIVINLVSERYKGVEGFEVTEKKKNFTRIQLNEVDQVLEIYKSRRNPTRNITILLLTLSLGLERSQILNLKWTDFDKDLKYIFIDTRKIEICPLLNDYLIQLRKEKEIQKIKTIYVLVTYFNGEYKQMNESAINDVFDELQIIDDGHDWKAYSPKYIRNRLIVSLFEEGYSLDEIIYITGIDTKNISKYITNEMIIKRGKANVNWNKLYSGRLCKDMSDV